MAWVFNLSLIRRNIHWECEELIHIYFICKCNDIIIIFVAVFAIWHPVVLPFYKQPALIRDVV